MATINGKINLLQLNGAVMNIKGKAGDVECIVVPIEKNHLFKGEKGIYLDIIGFEIKEPKENSDTHLLKQSFPKNIREAMTEEQKKNQPIIGNLRIWSGYQEADPVTSPDPVDEGDIDSLPF